MDSKKQKELSDILQQYNRHVSKLFKIIDVIVPNNPHIDLARRLIKILRNENPPAVLEKTIDKLWDNKDRILKRDAHFFKTCSFDKYIKVDSNKEWLDSLVNLVRIKYDILNDQEQTYIWDILNNMLKNVIEYRLIKGDFK